jgi:tetratricopeptide (TPR) repeat protein
MGRPDTPSEPEASGRRPAASGAALSAARRAVAARPQDARAWAHLGTLLARARRADEAASALETALRLAPGQGAIRASLGMVEASRGRLDRARELLARAAIDLPQAVGPLLALAHIAEGRGEFAAAASLYLEATRRDPRHLPAILGRGIALQRAGRSDEALEAFADGVRLDPRSPEAHTNQAAVLTELGRLDEAQAALERALEARPGFAAAEANLGEVLRRQGRYPEAADAFRRALAGAPDAPDVLNKLAVVQRILGDLDAAEELLRRALRVAPGHGIARVNLGTLCIERMHVDEGQALLVAALADGGLDAEARAEAEGTLQVLGEHARLREPIAQAVAGGDPGPLTAALVAKADASLPVDEVCLEGLTRLARSVAADAPAPPGFARRETAPADWAEIEAHFAFHRGDSLESLARSREILGAARCSPPGAGASAETLDLVRGARTFALARTLAAPGVGDGVAWEAWVRFWHAMLAWHRPEFFPGQIKPVSNLVRANPRESRTAPRLVAGTLRRFFAGPYTLLPAGPARAALLYHAVAKIHGFSDGNGRVGRLLANLELEAAGLAPLIIPDALVPAVGKGLRNARSRVDLNDTVLALEEAAKFTSAFLASARR